MDGIQKTKREAMEQVLWVCIRESTSVLRQGFRNMPSLLFTWTDKSGLMEKQLTARRDQQPLSIHPADVAHPASEVTQAY